MEDVQTKAALLERLEAARAAWDAALAEVPEARMTEPGVAGEWSVKDLIAHLTYYEGWIGDRLHEQLRGEGYTPTALDFMGEARNEVIVQQTRDRALADVRADSRAAFQRLLAGVQAHSEAFLIEPQRFEGAPGPVVVAQLLRGDVYEHYGQHIPTIRQWLAAHPA